MTAKTENADKRSLRGIELADVSKQQSSNTLDFASSQSAAAQRQRILEHLKFSSLTTLQAREQLDIMHPAARCMELRKRGLNIRTEWTVEHSAGGSKHRIARYILEAATDE